MSEGQRRGMEGTGYDGHRTQVANDILSDKPGKLGIGDPGLEEKVAAIMTHLGLLKLVQALYDRFQAQDSLEDINNAVRCGQLAISLASDDQEMRLELLKMLGIVYLARFEYTGKIADADKSINCHVQVLRHNFRGREGKPSLLQELGNSWMARFARTGEVGDINKAIGCYDQAALLILHGNPGKPGLINRRGNAYLARFDRLGEAADIEKAIECHGQAVLLAPDDHIDKPGFLNNLGTSHLARFERGGEVSDIDRAIEYQCQAVLLTPDSNKVKPMWHGSLGSSYLSRFERLGDVSDIDKTIENYERAALLTPPNHPEKLTWLRSLGNSYMQRFNRFGELTDADKAIDYHGQAALLAPDGHKENPAQPRSLGGTYEARFEHNSEVTDVNKAIERRTQTVLIHSGGFTDRAGAHNNLGNAYQDRFGRLGTVTDIDKAIECHKQALSTDSNNSAWLNDLGTSYMRRFDRLGELEDIEKAIDYHNQALSLCSDKWKATQLNNLGTSYLRRFERLGELEDIDKSIHYHRQTVLYTPDGHADKPTWLTNLGNSYASRFRRLDDLSDIDKAIEFQRQAVLLALDGDPNKPSLLNNLGTSYNTRFQSVRELADCNNAIHCHAQVVLLTPENHADRPSRLNNLGIAYLRRFGHNGEVADIDKAIEYLTQAVLLIPHEHPDKPFWLSNLGSSYRDRFVSNGQIADIDKAIEYQSQAGRLTPVEHVERPEKWASLGESYLVRFKSLKKVSDLKRAYLSFALAAQSATGDPYTRYTAARSWALSSLLLDTSVQPAYQRVMDLMPELVWIGSTIDQRYDRLAQIGGIAMEAAASAISVQMFDLALEWLEQGRSIVWNQILQLRTKFDDLSEADPALAERLKAVGRALERAGSRSTAWSLSPVDMSDPEQGAQDHRRLAAEWNKLLEAARLIPGFDDFLRPRKANDLMKAAKNGPVVVINVHSSRCDALIILPNSDRVVHVPLDNLTPEKVVEARVQLQSTVGHRSARGGGFKRIKPVPNRESMFRAMLVTLWTDVVQPILNLLGYTGKLPVNELPHITWCTTGALSFLPLHAAGRYDGLNPNTVDLVVSSYAPTLGALLTPRLPSSQSHSGILAVGQESTKGLSDLPYTVPELAAIRDCAKATRHLQLDGENATVEAVLGAMDAYSWVHLACHASQNATNPALSAFHLHDGDLLLSTVTMRSFENKGLAFLSACQTASGDENLPDEAVHLAAGMLMAGYPSVIATLWGINDEDAPEVAQRVYVELLEDRQMDHAESSRALHKAVAELREKIGEGAFQRWVPFVHIGS